MQTSSSSWSVGCINPRLLIWKTKTKQTQKVSSFKMKERKSHLRWIHQANNESVPISISSNKAAKVNTLEGVLFHTVTLNPPLSRFMAIALPIIPKPKKPTSIFLSSSLQITFDLSLPLLLLDRAVFKDTISSYTDSSKESLKKKKRKNTRYQLGIHDY